MKKIYSFLMATALLAAGVAMTGCNKDNNSPEQQKVAKTYHMSIKASKGADNNQTNGPRRVFGLDGNTLNATWAVGEQVYVVAENKNREDEYDDYFIFVGTLSAETAGASTTLSGEITGNITAGDQIMLFYPCDFFNRIPVFSYESQYGIFEGLSWFDHATALINVTNVDGDGNIYTASTANFVNQQAIVKFTLLKKEGEASIYAKTLNIEDAASKMVTKILYWKENGLTNPIKDTYGSISVGSDEGDGMNEIWVAISSTGAMNLTLTADDGTRKYEVTKNGVSFEHGQFYQITLKMTDAGASEIGGSIWIGDEP